MPKKKKEVELTNIDLIVKKLKSEIKDLKSTIKLDGITIECETKAKPDMKLIYDNIRKFCTDNNLNPISFETNKDRVNTFIVQFPEYENKFTEEEKDKLYKDNFKFLIDSLYRNDPNKTVTKEVVIKSRDLVIRQCLSIFFRAYANQYKEFVTNWYQDEDLMRRLKDLYREFLVEYYEDKE